MKGLIVKVQIQPTALLDCKQQVDAYRNNLKGFKEMGGYLIGKYDGNFLITQFILDRNAEATPVRIKLSADCFQMVQDILSRQPGYLYVGTWHVHPGKSKASFSHTDESTLFLEKLVLKTDNPTEYQCPRIHLIFSEDLELISAFTMIIGIDYTCSDYFSTSTTIDQNTLGQFDELLHDLTHLKENCLDYNKTKDLDLVNEVFCALGEAREKLDSLIDKIEDLSDFQEIFEIVKRDRKDLTAKVKSKIKAGHTLGLIILNPEEKIDIADYKPHLIMEHQEVGALIGFWRHYQIVPPPPELQEIFFANFYNKVEADLSPSYLYICSTLQSITFNALKFLNFQGISFEEVEITPLLEDGM